MPVKKKTEKEDLNLENNQGTSNVFDIENVEVKETQEKEDSLPLSLVQRMMKEVEERLTNQFSSQINKLKEAAKRSPLEDDLSYVSELEDDWLDQPVVFFAFSLNFSIHGDKKKGAEDLPPHGAIRFAPLIRTKRKGHKGPQVISVSSVKIQSQQVVDYLRNHSQFGIAFYENMGSAMSVDSTWAQKMIEAQQSISRLSDMQIIARAKQEGVSISQSPEGMRKQLIEIQAKRSIDQQNRMLYGGLQSAKIDVHTNRSIVEKTISD
jgi:Txe/YoeB family toxin of Txe-Axe toxin-antitoxin module